jgi:hypothetical protein
MATAGWTEANTKRAEAIWAEYQRDHDLSGSNGQTVGIDPALGRIWFGNSIEEVIAKRDADGSAAPLFFLRVGSPTYYRKGGHR